MLNIRYLGTAFLGKTGFTLKSEKEENPENQKHFSLPEYGWQQNFYGPMQAQKHDFLGEFGHVEETRQVVANELELERSLFLKYKEFYGYVLYVMRKQQ